MDHMFIYLCNYFLFSSTEKWPSIMAETVSSNLLLIPKACCAWHRAHMHDTVEGTHNDTHTWF